VRIGGGNNGESGTVLEEKTCPLDLHIGKDKLIMTEPYYSQTWL